MDNCVVAVAVAVAAYLRRKQKTKTIARWALDSFWGCSIRKMQSCPRTAGKHICSLCNVSYGQLLGSDAVVGGRLHRSVCMARSGLQAAFV